MARTKFESEFAREQRLAIRHILEKSDGNPSQFLGWLKRAIEAEVNFFGHPDFQLSRTPTSEEGLFNMLYNEFDGVYDPEEDRGRAWQFFNNIADEWKGLHPDKVKTKHNKKASIATGAIELERFKKLSPVKQEEFVQDLLEDLYSCEDKNAKLQQSVENLKLTFNKAFLEGRYNRKVSIKYAEEIMVYMCIRHIAVKDTIEKNKGKRAQYDIFYTTDGKRLTNQFGLKYCRALKVLRNLVEMGALKIVTTGKDQLCTYKLGHRVRSREGYLVNSFYFTLGNMKVRRFYEKKKHKRKARKESE
jgi:hypothetical protein